MRVLGALAFAGVVARPTYYSAYVPSTHYSSYSSYTSSFSSPRTAKNDPVLREVADMLRGMISRLSKQSLISTRSGMLAGSKVSADARPVLEAVRQHLTDRRSELDPELADVVDSLTNEQGAKIGTAIDQLLA
mmetsp:Transcript_6340/g.15344  ORF Transcript_6340/g.15344 Transcript_6340/m.15344 type:complete len:133 (+) Transcript_6340:58-456(+)